MITRLLCVFFALLLLMSFRLSAETHQSELLNRLYEKAGLEVHLQTLQISLKQNCQAYEGYLDQKVLSKVCRSEVIRIAPQHYRTQMISSLAANLDNDQVTEILDWLDTPLGRRVAHMENSAEPLAAASYIREKLGSTPPRAIRLEFVDNLIQLLNAVEVSIHIATATAMEVAARINQKLPVNSQLDLKEIEQALQSQMPAMTSATRNDLRQRFLYTYRQLPDEQLRSYIQFAQNESVQVFYRSVFSAMKSSL